MRYLVAALFALIPCSSWAGQTTLCTDMGGGISHCTATGGAPRAPVTFTPTPTPSVAEQIAAGQVIGNALRNIARPRRTASGSSQAELVAQWRAADITPDTGNSYYEHCNKALASGMCYGYLQGFVEREQIWPSHQICLPRNATMGQLMDTLMAFLRANPADRDVSLGAITHVAFARAFPCAPESPPQEK